MEVLRSHRETPLLPAKWWGGWGIQAIRANPIFTSTPNDRGPWKSRSRGDLCRSGSTGATSSATIASTQPGVEGTGAEPPASPAGVGGERAPRELHREGARGTVLPHSSPDTSSPLTVARYVPPAHHRRPRRPRPWAGGHRGSR